MTKGDENLRRLLKETFREEADEYLAEIKDALITLEKDGLESHPELAKGIYRRIHSLKGAARPVNMPDVLSLCQNIENIYAAITREGHVLEKEDYDIIHKALNAVKALSEDSEIERGSVPEIVAELKRITDPNQFQTGVHAREAKIDHDDSAGKVAPADIRDNHVPQKIDSRPEAVRISSDKLDSLIRGSDNLLTLRLFISERIKQLDGMITGFDLWSWNDSQAFNEIYNLRQAKRSEGFPELPPEFEHSLDNLLSFLDFNREFVTNLKHDLSGHIRTTEIDQSELEAGISEITDLIHEAVLVPISSIFRPLPAYVREISKILGKEAELVIEGGNIEMDRRILQPLSDPVMHLIRNSIDHGIEEPDERVRLGKPRTGKITIKAFTLSGNRAGLKISDDGAGIDTRAVKKKAVEKGILTEKESILLTDDDAMNLIFRSGLTTRPIITDLSGRGLGLAIVAEAIANLNGTQRIHTERGKGTEITIILPLKLATFRGIIVRTAGHRYIFPKQQVKKVSFIDVQSGSDRMFQKRVLIDGEPTGLFRLSDALDIPDLKPMTAGVNRIPVVILSYGVGQIGFVVDEIIRVQEVVVRSTGSQLKRVKRIAGAAILGDGEPAIVLDPLELIEETIKPSGTRRKGFRQDQPKGRVLIVEDSITSREFLWNIIRSAGYTADTAKDGAEALLKLREDDYDLVVSDVDMPRMSGFTLAEKIRTRKRNFNVPIIFITSLDSPENVKDGMTVGANAYIPKKSFKTKDFLKIAEDLVQRQAAKR